MPESVRIDLSPVVDAINVVNRNMDVVAQQIDAVGTRVDAVAHEQANTRQRIEQLYQEFQDYV